MIVKLCRCGHSETAHDLNPKDIRTRCSLITRKGPCGCLIFDHRFDETWESMVRVLPHQQ